MNIDYALSRERRPDLRYRLRRRTEEVLRVLSRHAPSARDIIDLGTAEGKMLRAIKGRYPSSWCLGVDYSLPLLLYGRKQFCDTPMICADVQDLAFLKNGTSDVIIAAAVIEHLVHPQVLLNETVRVLRDGGILIITSPHPFWEKVSGFLGWIKGEHHSVMTPTRLADLCRKSQLTIREDYGFMISPVGLWGEKWIEAMLRKIGVDRFLPNHLLVAQKAEANAGLRHESVNIPS
ncbi:MAG: class I SAM-dependent methyltransferase [Candidatus Aminicenantales bacterium]